MADFRRLARDPARDAGGEQQAEVAGGEGDGSIARIKVKQADVGVNAQECSHIRIIGQGR